MIIARVLRIVLLLTSCLSINQVFAAAAEHHWDIKSTKEQDAVVELERFLGLLLIEDEQTKDSMHAVLDSFIRLTYEQRLQLLYREDEHGNAFLHQVVLCSPKIHQKNKEIYLHFIQFLLNYGFAINRQNRDGNTCLHLAYQVRSVEIAGILELSPCIDVTRKNRRGEAANRQIIPASSQYETHEIPSIGENIFWCFKALCILHDGECS